MLSGTLLGARSIGAAARPLYGDCRKTDAATAREAP